MTASDPGHAKQNDENSMNFSDVSWGPKNTFRIPMYLLIMIMVLCLNPLRICVLFLTGYLFKWDVVYHHIL